MGNEASRGGGGKKGIVVVRDGTVIKPANPDDDPEMKRLKEMPRFLPILRSAIGRRDICDHRDISPRPFLQLSLRLSNHFSLCAKAVNTKQNQLSASIKTVDTRLSEMGGEIRDRKRRLDRLCEALDRVDEMNEELQKLNDTMGALLATLDDLSLILPPSITLDPFSLSPPPLPSPSTSSPSPYPSSSAPSTPFDSPRRIQPIEEIQVVDQVPKQAKR